MKFISIIPLVVFVLVSTGCPRPAHVKVYNNTGVPIQLANKEDVKEIAPGSAASVEFHYEITITSEKGLWRYDRRIPIRGDDEQFFDGTLTLQIESSGLAYAVPLDKNPPILDLDTQPKGFPIRPIN